MMFRFPATNINHINFRIFSIIPKKNTVKIRLCITKIRPAVPAGRFYFFITVVFKFRTLIELMILTAELPTG